VFLRLVDQIPNVKLMERVHLVLAFQHTLVLHPIADQSVASTRTVQVIRLVFMQNVKIRALDLVVFRPSVTLSITLQFVRAFEITLEILLSIVIQNRCHVRNHNY
jgi:hypothetical protein